MSDAQEHGSRSRLIAAVRARMRHRSSENDADRIVERVGLEPPARPAWPLLPDPVLEQLGAEARYHRDRYELYRAGLVSGRTGTSLGRMRELERTAAGAEERLAHARRRA